MHEYLHHCYHDGFHYSLIFTSHPNPEMDTQSRWGLCSRQIVQFRGKRHLLTFSLLLHNIEKFHQKFNSFLLPPSFQGCFFSRLWFMVDMATTPIRYSSHPVTSSPTYATHPAWSSSSSSSYHYYYYEPNQPTSHKQPEKLTNQPTQQLFLCSREYTCIIPKDS